MSSLLQRRRAEDKNFRISPKQASARSYIQPIHFRNE